MFRAGATSQFVLHGNVFDLVPAPDGERRTATGCRSASSSTGTMFQPFDVVIRYDRGRGVHRAAALEPARDEDEPPARPYWASRRSTAS